MFDGLNTVRKSKSTQIFIFWIRLVLWLCASCVIPISTFAIKFGLFKKDASITDSLGNVITPPSISLNGWGIVSCIIIGYTINAVCKELIAAYPKYSLAKQWLTGFTKTVLPLIVAFYICMFLNEVLTHVMFCLGTIAVCQFVAIPLNPLPKWRYEKSGVEDYSSMLNCLTEFVKSKNVKGRFKQ